MGVDKKAHGYALLVDYAWCTGCHSCEMACRKEHGLSDTQYGIRVNEMIWPIADDEWQYTYVPVPTDQCDTCVSRRERGKAPTCVHHCQAQCLEFGTADEMLGHLSKDRRQALYVL